MTNKVLIGVFIIISLALSGAGISWVKNNVFSAPIKESVSTEITASASASLAPSANQNQQTSLKDLWRNGVSQKCTFADGSVTGTTYVSDGQMKGDFSTSVNGKSTTSHMIVQGDSSYVWMDGQSQGYKVSIENISQQIGASSSGAIDLNREFNVECQSEAVESSKFTLPQNIQFQDMGSLNQNMTKATNSGTIDLKAAQCGACDKLPGGAKDQCKKALSC